MNFTKGEWIKTEGNQSTSVVNVKQYNGNDVYYTPVLNAKEREENAKLIAIAPEMFECLLKLTSEEHIEQSTYEYLIKQAKQVIQKAF